MNIAAYLDEVRAKYASGQATEHSYRPALQTLFESLDPAITVINEPKKSEAGMPDFLFARNGIPFGWAEAKDIDKDVIKLKGYSVEQRKRYEKAYPNLIYTNGVDFEFIREGQQVHFVSIADFLMGLQPSPGKFEELERQLKLFAEQKPISIRSAAKLAEMMAAKAAIIKDEIGIALADDPDFRSGLGGQFKSFKANLLPALEPDEFADIYAETITYGMFAARFHDDDLTTFSRQEALDKLPASNPFLKGLFRYIAGTELPRRLEYIVDDLVQVMRASDPHSLFRDFGKFTARNDPFIHFYEDFLAAYNPKKRKSRGVWYTPEPVVDFIVRAVDDVLKTEFGLADGLADTSKVTVDWDTGQDDPKTGKPRTVKKEVHKVQILDPATGTGTFLAKAVQLISDRVKMRAPGKWSNYVEQDLLPRLHGFELLMASYAMCHMKLDMMLTETGYKPSAKPPRLSVWLTNSLERAVREVRDLFFQPLVEEARGANEVKRQSPIMCVIGNPPYSVRSENKGDWILKLCQDYKRDLNEKNIQSLSDDYVKFIRLGQRFIERNGAGVLAYVTNNSYVDGIIHRRMREELSGNFDKIYILNLHGDSNKRERAPDGGRDQNVFDIQQGVAVIIAIKGAKKPASPAVFDSYGVRAAKQEMLFGNSLETLKWRRPEHDAPYFFLSNAEFLSSAVYARGFSLQDAFTASLSGVVTGNDAKYVGFERADLAHLPQPELSRRVLYRPLDSRYIYYDVRKLQRAREEIFVHMIRGENLALITPRQALEGGGGTVFDGIVGHKTFSAYHRNYVFPLYSYGQSSDELELASPQQLNFDDEFYAAICAAAGIDPADQATPPPSSDGDGPPLRDKLGEELADFRAATGDARPSEVKVFDYIYGVLHSPNYRATFAEFLKIDFPRIPYPPSPAVFAHVSAKGEQLRRLHLMEAAAIGEAPYVYHGPEDGEGDDVVAKGYPKWEPHAPLSRAGEGEAPSGAEGEGVRRRQLTPDAEPPHPGPLPAGERGKAGRVYINKDQYFADVPEIAWGFHIGGYQPAQKWLKDRRGRALSWDDIGHYQKIVKILVETDRIMREIELPLEAGVGGA